MNRIKRPFSHLLVFTFSLLTIASLPLRAQEAVPVSPQAQQAALNVATPPSTPQVTFFETVSSYFTSFNTNLDGTFGAESFNLWAGTDNLNNEQMTAVLGIEWISPSKISLEGTFRNATVAGTLITGQGGIGYNWVYHDTKVTAYLDGGYKLDSKEPFIAPGLRVKKALTPNTFAGIGLELDIYANNHHSALNPTLSIFAGFKL